jgi:hypothetical protein
MSVLTTLKLVTSKRPAVLSPIVQRRNKLAAKVHEQLELCQAKKAGQQYAPTKMRTFVNPTTGEQVTKEVAKRVREWFYVADSGKINLTIRYGSKTLALNKKGANAIELSTGDELIATLTSLKTAILAGDFDEAINDASNATRTAFGK